MNLMLRNFFGLILIFLLATAFQGPLETWLGGGGEKVTGAGDEVAMDDSPCWPSGHHSGRNREAWLLPTAQNDGYLRKVPQPHTNNLGAWALFLDGKVEGPFMFKVTAYNHADPYTPGKISASGVHVFEGMAACGSPLNLGDVVVLENGMVLRCLDRGNGGDWWVDVYLDSLDEAQRFGAQMIRGVVLRQT